MFCILWLCFMVINAPTGVLPCTDVERLVATARIESCTGCELAKYPEVKRFIEMDIRDFDGVTFKQVPGLLPEIVFFNKQDQELERKPLKCTSREDCSKILIQKGFKRNLKSLEESHGHKGD